MSGRNLREDSRTGFFLRALFPNRSRHDEPIRLPGLACVPEEIRSKKILIVDDDAVILKTLSLKLERVGYQVTTAADGSDAIRCMRDEKPDLILLDIHYPPDVSHGGGLTWDGFILMKWLSAMENGPGTLVIFITGSMAPGFKERALASGALGLFEKPIDHARLLGLIQKALAGKRGADLDAAP